MVGRIKKSDTKGVNDMSRVRQQDKRITLRLKGTLLHELIKAATLSNYGSVSEYIRYVLTENVVHRREYEGAE